MSAFLRSYYFERASDENDIGYNARAERNYPLGSDSFNRHSVLVPTPGTGWHRKEVRYATLVVSVDAADSSCSCEVDRCGVVAAI